MIHVSSVASASGDKEINVHPTGQFYFELRGKRDRKIYRFWWPSLAIAEAKRDAITQELYQRNKFAAHFNELCNGYECVVVPEDENDELLKCLQAIPANTATVASGKRKRVDASVPRYWAEIDDLKSTVKLTVDQIKEQMRTRDVSVILSTEEALTVLQKQPNTTVFLSLGTHSFQVVYAPTLKLCREVEQAMSGTTRVIPDELFVKLRKDDWFEYRLHARLQSALPVLNATVSEAAKTDLELIHPFASIV